jgi:hypothetical protein
MSCCAKEHKSKPAESPCCEQRAQENATKPAEKPAKSGCGCAAESRAKREEHQAPSCC